MPPKKLYPRKKVLRIAVSAIEYEAACRAAAEKSQTPSDWGWRAMGDSLQRVTRHYFPDDALKMEHERAQNGTQD